MRSKWTRCKVPFAVLLGAAALILLGLSVYRGQGLFRLTTEETKDFVDHVLQETPAKRVRVDYRLIQCVEIQIRGQDFSEAETEEILAGVEALLSDPNFAADFSDAYTARYANAVPEDLRAEDELPFGPVYAVVEIQLDDELVPIRYHSTYPFESWLRSRY